MPDSEWKGIDNMSRPDLIHRLSILLNTNDDMGRWKRTSDGKRRQIIRALNAISTLEDGIRCLIEPAFEDDPDLRDRADQQLVEFLKWWDRYTVLERSYVANARLGFLHFLARQAVPQIRLLLEREKSRKRSGWKDVSWQRRLAGELDDVIDRVIEPAEGARLELKRRDAAGRLVPLIRPIGPSRLAQLGTTPPSQLAREIVSEAYGIPDADSLRRSRPKKPR